MVYCGKPSKGCENCRKKRTRCDLAQPSCGQCRRAGRTCLGYRDIDALNFRDQSQDTASKFNVISGTEQRGVSFSESPPPTVTPASGDEYSGLTQPAFELFAPARPPYIPADDQAVGYFFSNYMFSEQSFGGKGYNEYLPAPFFQASKDSPLHSALTSVGLAGLAHRRDDPRIASVSGARYAQALQRVNVALRIPDQAVADETLMTVLLLGLYELVTGRVRRSLKAWVEHIMGATALVQLRGKDQLRSRVGLQLFFTLRTQIITGCLRRRTAVPQNLIAWSRFASKSNLDIGEAVWDNQMADIAFRITNFRAEQLSAEEDYSRPAFVIKAMQDFETELASWEAGYMEVSAFSTIQLTERSDEVFSDYYHMFPTSLSGLIWNHFDLLRSIAHETMLAQIVAFYYQTYFPSMTIPPINSRSLLDVDLPVDFEYRNQFFASHSTLSTTYHRMCAATPFFLGFPTYGEHWDKADPPVPTAKGHLLLWPLWSISSHSANSPMMRKWALNRLKKIAQVMGISQAAVMAEQLETGGTYEIDEPSMSSEFEKLGIEGSL